MARPTRRTTQEKKAAPEATGEFYASLDAVLPVIIAAVTKNGQNPPKFPAELGALIRETTKRRLGSPHLTIAETATYIGITPDTLKRKMKCSDIPVHRRPGTAPYFLKPELDQWLSDPATLCEPKASADCSKEAPCDETKIRELVSKAKPPMSRTERYRGKNKKG